MNSMTAQETAYEDHLLVISAAIDEFEGYAQPHGKRVATIATALARKFNFAAHDTHALGQAALVHDAGELVMNREYIKANRVLREDERVDVQRHTVIGEQEAAKRGLSRAVQLLVRWHHEWWNGGGYPDALTGEQIPLAARILRLADTYAAMTEARPHRAAISAAEAKRYLIEWAGIEFDPRVVKYFLLLDNQDYEPRKTNVDSPEQVSEEAPNEQRHDSLIELPPNVEQQNGESNLVEELPVNSQQQPPTEAPHGERRETPLDERQTAARSDEQQSNAETPTSEATPSEQLVDSPFAARNS